MSPEHALAAMIAPTAGRRENSWGGVAKRGGLGSWKVEGGHHSVEGNPEVVGDPERWRVEGDPERWRVEGDPERWVEGNPEVVGDPERWRVEGDPERWRVEGDPERWVEGNPEVVGDPERWRVAEWWGGCEVEGNLEVEWEERVMEWKIQQRMC